MRLILIILTVAIIGGGSRRLIAWSQGRADEGTVNRSKAAKIMSQNYGDDWLDLMIDTGTNHAQVRAMAAAYELAIGYHRTR